MNKPTEFKRRAECRAAQKDGKCDWRGKGRCMCPSHTVSKMLLGRWFKTFFEGRNDSTPRWNITHTSPPCPHRKQNPNPTKKHQVTKPTLGEALWLLLGVKEARMRISHIPWPVPANTRLVTPAPLDNTNTSLVISSKTSNKSTQLCCNRAVNQWVLWN